MSLLGPSNPLTYAFFHARGGLRSHLMYAIISGFCITALLAGSAQLSGDRWAQTMSSWANILLVIAPLIFSLTSMISITTAVRTDLTSGMADSLRLMRVSPYVMVAGYITGGVTQGLALCVPLVIAGGIASALGGVGAAPFIWGQMLIFSSSLVMIVACVYLGQSVRFNAMPLVLSALIIPASFALGQFSPAVTLLAVPIAGRGAFDLSRLEINPGLIVGFVAQALTASIFFIAAARRLQNPSRPAFTPDLGLALSTIIALFGLVGVILWSVIRYRFYDRDASLTHIVGIAVPALILGLIPAIAAGRISGEQRRALVFHELPSAPGKLPWWAWSAFAAVVGSAAPLLAFLTLKERARYLPHAFEAAAITLVSILATLLILAALTRRLVATGLNFKIVAFLVALAGVVVLGGPLVIQWLVLAAETATRHWSEQPHVAQYSPLAAIVLAWDFNQDAHNPTETRLAAVVFILLTAAVLTACRLPRLTTPPPLEGSPAAP